MELGLVFLLLLTNFYETRSDASYDVTLLKGLLADYDWKLRPIGKDTTKRKGGPVEISVNILLRTISKIDDVNMEFSTQFTFRQSWNDQRLAYGNLGHPGLTAFEADGAYLDGKKMPDFIILVPGDHNMESGENSYLSSTSIWLPDTFFQNEKSAHKHMVDKPNILIRIYPNGDVLYSVRLSLVLSCPMSLADYPMDKQDCFIDFSSYAYTTDDIVYEWSNDTPVQMKDTVKTSLPSFDLGHVLTKHCVSNTSTGEYSCLRVHLHFQRMFSYYLLQLYIPSFMLVIVSWVSFWVDKSSVPARVTLGVTTLLTITTQASGINAKLPPVSYTKAIDVWIGVCLAFVFGALLEYALVNYADEGHMGRRGAGAAASSSKSAARGESVTRERTFAEAATASEVSPLFFHSVIPTNGQQHQQQIKRAQQPGFTINGQQAGRLSPLLGRYNTSYRWTEDEEAAGRRVYLSPTEHMAEAALAAVGPPVPTPAPPPTSSCPNCVLVPPMMPPVRSFADRRLAPPPPSMMTAALMNRWKQAHKLPLYRRLRNWAVSLYHEADRAKKIDVISRVVFPFFFMVFNCIYWTVY